MWESAPDFGALLVVNLPPALVQTMVLLGRALALSAMKDTQRILRMDADLGCFLPAVCGAQVLRRVEAVWRVQHPAAHAVPDLGAGARGLRRAHPGAEETAALP